MPKHLRLTSIIVLCFFATAPFALATSCDNGCCYGQCTCYDCGGTSGSDTVSSIGEAIVGEFMPPSLGTDKQGLTTFVWLEDWKVERLGASTLPAFRFFL